MNQFDDKKTRLLTLIGIVLAMLLAGTLDTQAVEFPSEEKMECIFMQYDDTDTDHTMAACEVTLEEIELVLEDDYIELSNNVPPLTRTLLHSTKY